MILSIKVSSQHSVMKDQTKEWSFNNTRLMGRVKGNNKYYYTIAWLMSVMLRDTKKDTWPSA